MPSLPLRLRRRGRRARAGGERVKQTAHKGTTAKHAGTHKHTQGKGKHHPAKAKKAQTHHHAAKKQKTHTAAKGPTLNKPLKLARADAPVRAVITPFASRGRVDGAAAWAELDDVACCTVLALAESLRLSGRLCGADDVLALYGLLASDADAGATIVATLDEASVFGLAGVRPVSFHPHAWDSAGCPEGDIFGVDDLDAAALTVEAHALPPVQREPVLHGTVRQADHAGSVGRGVHLPSVILGLELPGPHAVLAEQGRWWSWSQPWPPAAFPDAVVEECWQVVWP